MEQRKPASLGGAYLLAIIVAFIITAVGVWRSLHADHDWVTLAAGFASIVVVLTTYPLALALAASSARQAEAQAHYLSVNERLEQIAVLLNVLSEQQLLSDRAKSVAFREKDRDAVRRAIQEEINKSDWDAALALADDMESEFGYKTEAARFRDEIRGRRQDVVRKQIQDVVAVIDRHTRSEQWNGALREAERLMGMFPDNEQVKNLPNEIDQRRQAHKKQLVDSWNDAVARHDVDGSIEILKQLDMYLTPAEAEGLQETARGVFKEKLNLLSKHFADAVRDHRWAEAVRVGDSISREFPNTRIAQEVREKMETLKDRATEPAGGGAAVVPAGA